MGQLHAFLSFNPFPNHHYLFLAVQVKLSAVFQSNVQVRFIPSVTAQPWLQGCLAFFWMGKRGGCGGVFLCCVFGLGPSPPSPVKHTVRYNALWSSLSFRSVCQKLPGMLNIWRVVSCGFVTQADSFSMKSLQLKTHRIVDCKLGSDG